MNLSEKIIAFSQRYRLASHVVFWLLLFVIQVSSSNYYNADLVPFRNNLVGDGTNLLAQAAAAYFLTYFIVPRYVYRQKYLAALAWFVLCAYIVCVVSRLGVVHLEEPFYGLRPKPFETYIEILTDLPKLAYVYFFRIFSVAFVFMLLKLLKDQLAVQRRALALEKQKAEAELKLLKTQLNPHFLFNTLNNIYALALVKSAVTADAVARLSAILDYILYRCDSRYVPLSGEVALLCNYITLEKLRYGPRLTVHINNQANERVEIAPLLLLTIVENAFKHGAANDPGEPVVNIELSTSSGCFELTVTNPFQPGAPVNAVSIGLPNLKQQLELIYPSKHTLAIHPEGNLFIVHLTIYLP